MLTDCEPNARSDGSRTSHEILHACLSSIGRGLGVWWILRGQCDARWLSSSVQVANITITLLPTNKSLKDVERTPLLRLKRAWSLILTLLRSALLSFGTTTRSLKRGIFRSRCSVECGPSTAVYFHKIPYHTTCKNPRGEWSTFKVVVMSDLPHLDHVHPCLLYYY